MKDFIWNRRDANGNIPKPEALPPRTYWYARLASKYIDYDKLPWEMGYPHYEELDNILPFIIREWKKRIKEHIEREKEWQETRQKMYGK